MEPVTGSNPVTQMLASRAAAGPFLKELMKRVAKDRASPFELDVFQKHIDDIKAVLKYQAGDGRSADSSSQPATSADPSISTLLHVPFDVRKIIWDCAVTTQEIWFCQGANRDHTKSGHPVCIRKPEELINLLSLVCRQVYNDLGVTGRKWCGLSSVSQRST